MKWGLRRWWGCTSHKNIFNADKWEEKAGVVSISDKTSCELTFWRPRHSTFYFKYLCTPDLEHLPQPLARIQYKAWGSEVHFVDWAGAVTFFFHLFIYLEITNTQHSLQNIKVLVNSTLYTGHYEPSWSLDLNIFPTSHKVSEKDEHLLWKNFVLSKYQLFSTDLSQ